MTCQVNGCNAPVATGVSFGLRSSISHQVETEIDVTVCEYHGILLSMQTYRIEAEVKVH